LIVKYNIFINHNYIKSKNYLGEDENVVLVRPKKGMWRGGIIASLTFYLSPNRGEWSVTFLGKESPDATEQEAGWA
jgi:hypothetical protein